MFRPAHNTTDTPTLIDAAGRQLGGREWGPVDTRTDEVKAGVDRGVLVVFDAAKVTDDAISEAVDARRSAEALQMRHDALDALPADDVRKVADVAGVPLEVPMEDPDGRPGADNRTRHVRELVADLVYHPADLDQLLDDAEVAPAQLDTSSSSTGPTAAGEPAASSTSDASTSPAKATAPVKAAAARKSAPTIPTPEA